MQLVLLLQTTNNQLLCSTEDFISRCEICTTLNTVWHKVMGMAHDLVPCRYSVPAKAQGQSTATALPQAAAVVSGCSMVVKQCSSRCDQVTATEQMLVAA